jgi:ubiquinol-cytochrome c reductase cytochrome c1 subunit
MIRLVGILTGLVFAFVVLLAFVTGAYTVATEGMGEETAEHAFHREAHLPAGGVSYDGLAPQWDVAQLQRGYQVYKEVCSACHGLDHLAFRNLSELGYTEAEVKAEAASWTVPGIDPNTGEANTRPGTPVDGFPSPYANRTAAAAANNNAVPPDLSLITKARHHGSAYVYSLLTGYRDPATYTNEEGETLAQAFPDNMPGTGLHFNPWFANLNLAMAPPLHTAGQVTYADGTEASVPQMAADVAAFLTWAAEPSLVDRVRLGWIVMGFLLFLTVLAYLAKKSVWSQLKTREDD